MNANQFNPPGNPASTPPPQKAGCAHTEPVLVYYEANPELGQGSSWGIAFYDYAPLGGPSWMDSHDVRQPPTLWWPMPVAMPVHEHICYCGGRHGPHTVSEQGCFRQMAEAPVLVEMNADPNFSRWLVEGSEITEFTLRQQRGYHQHPCGCWSRSTSNSNSVDTD